MARTNALEVVAIGAPAPAATTVVLLHGFGAPGDDMVGLAAALEAAPRDGDAGASVPMAGRSGVRAGAPGTRFVMPAAPLELPGLYGDSRAWWMLDLARIERALAGIVEDRSDEVPDGLAEARGRIAGLVDHLLAEGTGRVVLGGFSQGAMLALDTLLHIDKPIAGLAFLSGTRINAAAWRARFARVRGLPIVMSHGTADPMLPFAAAASLRDELRAAGADVDWIEFRGGHEIPQAVLAGVNRLLARLFPSTKP